MGHIVEVVQCRGDSFVLAAAILAFVAVAFVAADSAFPAAVVCSVGVAVFDFADPVAFGVVSVVDMVEEAAVVAAGSMDCTPVREFAPDQVVVDVVVVVAADAVDDDDPP